MPWHRLARTEPSRAPRWSCWVRISRTDGRRRAAAAKGEGYLRRQRASKCRWSSCPARSGRRCSPAARQPRRRGPLPGQEGPGVGEGHRRLRIKGTTASWSQPCSPSLLETHTPACKPGSPKIILGAGDAPGSSEPGPTCARGCSATGAVLLGVLHCLERGVNWGGGRRARAAPRCPHPLWSQPGSDVPPGL